MLKSAASGRLRAVALAALLLTVPPVVAGCGPAAGPGAPGRDAAARAGDRAAPAEETQPPIRIGLSPWPGWFAWYLVRDKGFFDKHGVDVELVWFPVYSDSLQAFATGKVDGNSQTLSDTLPQAARGVPLRVVLVNDNSHGGDALIAKPHYRSVRDLRGRRVATEMGTVDHFLLLRALARHGMTEDDVDFVNMTINDAGPAFIAGRLDAAVLWEPFLSKAVAQGKGRILFSSRDTPGLIPDLLVLGEKVVRERPEEVRRILTAWFDALAWWRAHPDEALAIMAKYAETPVSDYRLLVNGVRIFTLADNLRAFEARDDFQSLAYTGARTAAFLKEKGLLDRVPDVRTIIDPSFLRTLAAQQGAVADAPGGGGR